MTNLFSMFDPSSSYYFSMNWISLFLIFIFIPRYMFTLSPRPLFMYNQISNFILTSLKTNIKKTHLKSLIILWTMFIFISLSNMLSLLPFFFNTTSHISISLNLAIPLWLSLMIKSWSKNTQMMLTHLLPSHTPLILCPFMISIEIISLLIRPLTLAIRLSANMIAGHLLMTLLSLMLNHNIFSFTSSSLILSILISLELAVALIQSFVFITLMSLYLNETL
uniref:ATP synthase subunit a n=1 Tax=Blattisocius tarsalis TaxID=1609195 RepID=A0A6B9WH49_9ACAR|nr:ATP synthase F0 subunit 6 [Blattisocius tarsalis]QHQ98564.1 ATP synthase subunit 6 [Blattisocius tarsalis]